MTDSPSIVGLIPARSGSKRLPDKNVRRLAGHPLLAYSVSSAIASAVFDAIVVSTDSRRYQDIARHYGAEAPFLRPARLAGDGSPDIEWVDHALSALAKEGREFDCFSILRPTSPFRQPATIVRAWQQFRADSTVDSLRAVEKCRQHPGKMWTLDGNRMQPLLPLLVDGQPWHSSQYAVLPEVFVQNASLEIAWTRVVLETGRIAGNAVMPFLTESFEGLDVNDARDWQLAELLLERKEAQLPKVDCEAYPAKEPRGASHRHRGARSPRGRG